MSESISSELWLNPAKQTYRDWIERYDVCDPRAEVVIRRALRGLRFLPLISVVMPVYNPEPSALHEAINSVRGQIYPNWELCLADDHSSEDEVQRILPEIATSDPRIRFLRRPHNGGIAACSNSALSLASGEWVALLDQDDLLAGHALAFVAGAINRFPRGRLFYSDEDKIDENGQRTEPYHKSDWNPQLFLVQNFISHLGVYSRRLLNEIGGFREGFEGSQDYDLALRCIEKLAPDQIIHLPRVLYHWRKSPTSLAARSDAKAHAHDSARRALREHLERTGTRARIVPCPENPAAHRVEYELPSNPPLVSLIIPTRDHSSLLRRCLETVSAQSEYSNFEVVIVDNGSTEAETLAYFSELKDQADLRIISAPGPFNFSALVNRGVAESRGDLVLLMNDDIEATEAGWLREMVAHLMQPNVGVVGARLWYPDQTLQHGGVILGFGGVAGHAHARRARGDAGYFSRAVLQQNFSAVTAACVIIRREVFQQVGGFDEEHLPVSFNDIDFCLRVIDQGWEVRWTPSANLIHHESASRGRGSDEGDSQFLRELGYMLERWGERLMRDPFYNVNLSLRRHDFVLSWPPRVVPLAEARGLEC